MIPRNTDPETETRQTFRNILFRSSAYALLAYFIAFTTEKLLALASALLIGYPVQFDHNTLKINAGVEEWSQEAVLLIYLVPYIILILAFILMNIRLARTELTPDHSKIFILWLMLFIAYRLFGMLPLNILFKTGIFYAIQWLYLGPASIIAATVISLLIFLPVSYKIMRGILVLNGTYHNHMRDMGISNLLLACLIVPYASILLVSLIFFMPDPPLHEIAGPIIIGMIILSVYLKFVRTDPDVFSFKEIVISTQSPLRILLFVVGAIILLRLALMFGFQHG
jgi:hypothetical protein